MSRGRVALDAAVSGPATETGGAARALPLVRDDRDRGEDDQHDRDQVEPARHARHRACPRRVDGSDNDQQEPRRELGGVRGPRVEHRSDVAEGEERDDEGRRDDGATLRGAVEQRQQEQRGGRPEDRARERRADVDEQYFAQVLRVQEQDRVRGKQDRVQGNARQCTRFGRAAP